MSIVFTVTAGADITLTPSNGGTVQFTIEPIAHSIPAGGTDGQVLAKASDTDYDVEWVSGGGGGGATNLGYTASPTNGIVTSDTGTDATLPLGTGTNAGLLSPAQFTKLSNLSGTNTGDQDLSGYLTSATAASTYEPLKGADDNYVTDAEKVKLGNLSGTNTGDQASIVGITGTKAQFDTAVTDGNFMYVGDAPTAHTHPQSEVTNLTTDLAAKAPLASPTFTGTVTTPAIIVSSETASRVAIIDGSKNVKSADTTTYPSLTELAYVKGVTSAIQTQLDAKVAKATVPCEFIVACSDETTAITTGTAKVTFRAPYAFTLTAVRASVTTAPTGSTIVIDINEAGVSVLSTKLSIDASEKTSTTAATAAVLSDSAIADDAEITIDFDQVGSTIAGAGVKVTLIGTHAV